MQLGAERDAAALAGNSETAAAIERDFDPRATLAFYRDLAGLDDGALVTDVTCPMFAFWGTADEILWSFNTEPDFGQGLTDRGVATHPVAGLDHAETILQFDAIVGDVIEWPRHPWAQRRLGDDAPDLPRCVVARPRDGAEPRAEVTKSASRRCGTCSRLG